MAKQDAIQDNNQFPAMIAHTGTAGTADTVRVVASTDGAIRVDLVSGDTINIGTMTVGTIDNVVDGTISLLKGGTINTLKVGTINKLLAGTVTVVEGGSIVVTAGTIGSIPNIPGGTIDVVSSVTNLAGGTLGILTAGSVVMTAGTVSVLNTVGTVGKVEGGSIVMTVGTITAGTITAGTVKLDGRPARDISTYGTAFGGASESWGTLIAAPGAATAIWINDVSIVNTAGTITCGVMFGTATAGANVIAKGKFGPNGGIQKSFPLAVNGNTTNQDLVCYVGAGGTADFNVSYFISA